jgi:hypothetical protein
MESVRLISVFWLMLCAQQRLKRKFLSHYISIRKDEVKAAAAEELKQHVRICWNSGVPFRHPDSISVTIY